MNATEINAKLTELLDLPAEIEWVEFKEAKNNFHFDKVGEYFSGLSNEANLKNQSWAWLVFGVQDKPKQIVGSNYRRKAVGKMAFRLNQLPLRIDLPTEASSMAFPKYRRQELSNFHPGFILMRLDENDATPLQGTVCALHKLRQIAGIRHISTPLRGGCHQFVDHENHQIHERTLQLSCDSCLSWLSPSLTEH